MTNATALRATAKASMALNAGNVIRSSTRASNSVSTVSATSVATHTHLIQHSSNVRSMNRVLVSRRALLMLFSKIRQIPVRKTEQKAAEVL
jgi:hypothetical protein